MGDLLKDKVAVVTGGGRGIGRGVCLLMAEEGAKVVVNDLGGATDGTGASRQPADEVVAEIKAKGGTAVPSYDTVATMKGGENIIKTAVDSFGRVDILVTAAGILRDRMIFNMTEEEWDIVLAVHLKGTFALSKYASILMRQQRRGRIITFTSVAGLFGNSGQANYGSAKDGIAGLTRVMARDLGRYGVTVNCISPTAATRLLIIPQRAQEIRAASGIQGPEGRSPVQIRGDPEDIAPMVCWLASDGASDVNGQIFHCFGGVVALMGQPQVVKTMSKKGRWTVEEIAAVFPQTLGMDLVNPAPPAPPPPPQQAQQPAPGQARQGQPGRT